ncbi:MAG: hypothetical protein D6775_06775 [Caldilineae bacterium]|nr:MAG: hypothetical protein D6775_06775 [Caldilineae bacterium]
MNALNVNDLEQLTQALRQALSQWHTPQVAAPLASLKIFRAGRSSSNNGVEQAVRDVLDDMLDQLAAEQAELATLLRQRYLECRPMSEVAKELNRSEASAYRDQRRALEALARLIQDAEMQLRSARTARLEQRLEPPTYDKLFGVHDLLESMFNTVRDPEGPRLFLFVGMGGIGKTTLADALVRRIIEEEHAFEVGWVSARDRVFRLWGDIVPTSGAPLTPESVFERMAEQLLSGIPLPTPFTVEAVMPMLEKHLKRVPHVVVIDNLETFEDVNTLLPYLRQLSNPSRFILTSRLSLHGEPDVHHLRVPELGAEDALALIRHEARNRNIDYMLQASDEELMPIYQAVGGNPLALRLVVGQTYVHALPTVLEDLNMARGRSVEQLYTYIFHRAWTSLDEVSQRTLLSFPLVPQRGATFDHLAHITKLDPDSLHDALEILVRLNLVERRGNMHEVRFTIHSLTRSFLKEQVAKWQ